jgi:hypothetical protein
LYIKAVQKEVFSERPFFHSRERNEHRFSKKRGEDHAIIAETAVHERHGLVMSRFGRKSKEKG